MRREPATSTELSEADWAVAVDLLRGEVDAGRPVVLACHVHPDGDALGSTLALGVALRDAGAEVLATYGSEPFEVPRALAHLPGQVLLVPPAEVARRTGGAPDLVVTLDTGSADRLGTAGPLAAAAGAVLVVDHHASNTRFGTHLLLDTQAAATAVLVEELVHRLGLPLTLEVATAVYTGLTTDTGSFRFAATTPAVHALAARLLAAGVRHDLISRAVFDTSPFAEVQLLGRLLTRAELERDAVGGLGLVWTVAAAADLADLGVGLAEVEGVMAALRTTAEAEVALVLKPGPAGGTVVSSRSKGAVDVGAVCTALGGGGHRFAAGVTLAAAPAEALAVLRAALAAAPHLPV